MKILTVVGARPQFVKAAVVGSALRDVGGVKEVLVHTGQHYDANMSAVFFGELGLASPTYHLGIGGGSHAANTGRAMEKIEEVIIREAPRIVLVYGDTDSTLAGALASAKLNVPVAHVEAGLRSFNRRMPEEVNRVLTDHVSAVLFAPTAVAVKNLAGEGIVGSQVRMVGDVMLDAVRSYLPTARRKSDILGRLEVTPKAYVLATLHRQENVDDKKRLSAIISGLGASGRQIVLPLHPRTRKRLADFALDTPRNITLTDPLSYFDMMLLEANAAAIATDSGGVQKEAYFHGVPCLTLRDETEWVELVEIGANRLVGARSDDIAAALEGTLDMPAMPPLYGDGHASELIAAVLQESFG